MPTTLARAVERRLDAFNLQSATIDIARAMALGAIVAVVLVVLLFANPLHGFAVGPITLDPPFLPTFGS